MNILQNIVFPGYSSNIPDEMYLRCLDRSLFLRNRNSVCMEAYGKCSFGTYFNGFMLEGWRGKAKISTLFATLRGQGRVCVRFLLERHSTNTARLILEQEIILTEEGIVFSLDETLKWQDGMLYVELIALEDNTYFTGGEYWSNTQPTNTVKLGLVITHFNRKNYVLPAIERITQHILKHPDYQKSIKLIVVDNSSNILPEEAGMATLIPNQNLGGSGGFTRGLLHLIDDQTFTHCLFMDDDASCEIESILRTYTLLQYVTEEKFAVAGSLLLEDNPTVLHEKGAFLGKYGVQTCLHRGINIIDKEGAMHSERTDIIPNYGAWWFLAFKISDISVYPYPFFVRGDDILFSLTNQLSIFTLSGISCWGEDFAIKESPLTRYLSFRSILVCSVLLDNLPWHRFVKIYMHWALVNMFSYHYASAEAILMAAEDFMKGPSCFLDDMSAVKVREKIAPLSAQEKLSKIERKSNFFISPEFKHERWKKLFRIILLNGFLLPSFLLKNGPVRQNKGFRATFREIFRYKKVYYEYESEGVGYMAYHDKKKFFSLLYRLLKSLIQFSYHYGSIKKEYRDRMSEMTSLAFWRSIYDKNI
ncbi:MAG: hypothetical protein Q4A74_02655 [Cardiobacteriaceae bacterium]|nr:hypothetical protein [Cardiobacteriaceae bacterium]